MNRLVRPSSYCRDSHACELGERGGKCDRGCVPIVPGWSQVHGGVARFSPARLSAPLPELALDLKILEVELGYLLLEVIFVVVGLASLLVGV